MHRKIILAFLIVLSITLVACKKKVEFSFNNEEKTLNIGETFDLGYTITKGHEVEFSLSSEGVVKIEDNKVFANSSGEVIITGKVVGTDITDTIKIVVLKEEIIEFNFINDELTIELPSTYDLEYNVTSGYEVEFSISEEGIIELLEGNKVKSISLGVVTITGKVVGTDITDSIVIYVYEEVEIIPVNEVKIVGDSHGFVGDRFYINATVSPRNATDKTIVWESSDESLASVDGENRIITLHKAGTVTIIATAGGVTSSHEIVIQDLIIENEPTELLNRSELQLVITDVDENNYINLFNFYSSNGRIASVSPSGLIKTLNPGEVTITVKSYKSSLSFQIDITVFSEYDITIEFSENYNGYVQVGDSFQMDVVGVGRSNSELNYTFDVLDDDILEITEEGVFRALSAGKTEVLIYNLEELKHSYTIIVQEELSESRIDKLLNLLADGNNAVAKGLNVITYHTAYQEWSDPRHESVNLYLFDDYVIDSTSYPADPAGQSSGVKSSTEFILLHDTANLNIGLMEHGEFFQNPKNPVSIHYITGDYGILQSLPENIVAWHAGDGTGSFSWNPTGITAFNDNPFIDISEDGYFTFDNEKSIIQAPRDSLGQVLDRSYFTYLGPIWDIFDGEYYMAPTWFSTTQQRRGVIASLAGNRASIGIEMNVNIDGDIVDTVQRTAKLVANLLENHNLGMNRIIMHNTTDGKGDPYTLNNTVYNDSWYFDRFIEHVAIEREILVNYSDAIITLSSDSPLVSSTGRIIDKPAQTTEVEYTITVELDGESKSITLVTVVPGVNTWHQDYGFFVPTQSWALKGYRS